MAGHVYLIGSPIFHWYKIGKSIDAAIRVTDLGILLPFRVEVIAIWKVHDHHAAEFLMHEKYSKERINGEWFSLSHNQVRRLIVDMAAVQVRVLAGFSNIESDSIENVLKDKRHLPVSFGEKTRNRRGGKQARMDELTKETQALRERILELEKLLDNQDLPAL
jgi:hypothetical protein